MPDETTSARVFVSYSRRDFEQAQSIVDDLNSAGFEAFLDVHDIAPGEPWEARLGQLIAAAEKVVFLISPDSVASEICTWEVDEGERQAKGILPVLIRETDTGQIPGRLARLNFIFMRTSEEQAEKLDDLVSALSTDLEWEREKTEVNLRAQEWAAGGRTDRSLRFAENKIASWERWRDKHPDSASPPNALQLNFITEARRIATRRQRRIIVASVFATIVAIVLSIIAFTQREQAIANEQRAERERNAALTSQSQFLADLSQQELAQGRATKAMLIALEGLPDPANFEDRPLIAETDLALSDALGRVRLNSIHPAEAQVAQNWVSAVVGIYDEDGAWLIDPATGVPITELGFTSAAEYSADGVHVLTDHGHFARGAQTAALRDAATGAVKLQFNNADGYMGFSNTGRYLIQDRDVWDVATATMLYQRDQGGFASFSPDDAAIIETGRESDRAWYKVHRASDFSVILEGGGNFGFDGTFSRVVVQIGDWSIAVFDTASGEMLAALDLQQDRRGVAGLNSLVLSRGLPVVQIGHGSNPKVLWHYTEDRVEVAPERYSSRCPPGATPTVGLYDAYCQSITSPDGALRATLEEDYVALWDAQDNSALTQLEGHIAPVERLVFSPDSTLLLTLTRAETYIPYDFEAKLWDVSNGDLVATLDHAGQEWEGGFSPDGSQVWTGDGDTAKFWRVAPGNRPAKLEAAQAKDEKIVVSDRGRHAARINADGTFVLFNLVTGERGDCGSDAPVAVFSAGFTQDGSQMIVLGNDGSVTVWNPDCSKAASADALGTQPRGFAISGDGARLIADFDDAVVVLTLADLTPLVSVPRNDTAETPDYVDPTSATINHSGDRIAVTSRIPGPEYDPDPTGLQVFDAVSGDAVGGTFTALSAIFSPDGSKIALTGKDSSIVDAATGDRVANLPQRLEPYDQIAFDPTGRFLVVLSDDERSVLIFDATTGELLPSPDERWFYPFGLGPLDFSDDGTQFVLLKSGQDTSQNGFDVYETATGKILHQQIVGDGNDTPGSAIFGADDDTVIASIGAEILIYEMDSYAISSRMTAPGDYVETARLGAGGAHVITSVRSDFGAKKAVVAMPFHTTTPERIHAARRSAARCLSPGERRENFVTQEPPAWCITGPGLESEGNPENWRPLYPYQDPQWALWLSGEDVAMPE